MGTYDHYTLDDGSLLNEQEIWILERVAKGQEADLLVEYGPDPRPRHLRAIFLEKLLTDGFAEKYDFKVHRKGILIKSAIIADPVDLEDADINSNVALDSCIFKKIANFRDCCFNKHLSFNKAQFIESANFRRLKVMYNLSCEGSLFCKQVEFAYAEIKRHFIARKTQFLDKKNEADFYGLKVGCSLSFRESIFKGPVDFSKTNAGGQFIVNGAKFINKNGKAVFNGLLVGFDASFSEVEFRGPVDLSYSNIGGQLLLDRARFLSEKVNLSRLNVAQEVIFSGTILCGNVSLDYASLLDLIIKGVDKNNFIPILSLEQTEISRELKIENVEIGELYANHLHGNGPSSFKNVSIDSFLDLRDSIFQNFNLINYILYSKKNDVLLDGLIYKSISTKESIDEPEDYEKLFNLLENSRFNAQNYIQMEEYFKRCGQKDRADEIYIKGKQRELSQRNNLTKLVIKIFWEMLAGYGRKPGRTFWISLGVVILGMLFFDHQHLDQNFKANCTWLSKVECWKSVIIAFLLSLGHFLPGIDVVLTKSWQVSQVSFCTLLYYYFHKICGWILVPIGLAAIFSNIRK